MSKSDKHIIITVTRFIVFHWVCRSCGQPNHSKVFTSAPGEIFDCESCADCLSLDIRLKQFAYHYKQL